MRYEEFAPAPELTHLIACYLSFTVPSHEPEPIHHFVVPDGAVSLVYIRLPHTPQTFFRLVGPRLEALQPPTMPGGIYWGIRLQPGVAGALLPISVPSLRDQVIHVADCAPAFATRVEQALSGIHTIEAAAQVFDAQLLPLAQQALPLDQPIMTGIKALIETYGQAAIAALAAAAHLSERQFLRRFRAVTGLTPKEFARIRRLRAAAIAMAKHSPSLADLAAHSGFSDQSHMAHEFSHLTGLPPTSFAERLRRVQHEQLLAAR
jgi:AraC-like DNA-binding protein